MSNIKIRQLRIDRFNREYFVLPSHMVRGKEVYAEFNGARMKLGEPFDRIKKFIDPVENKYFFMNFYYWNPERTLFSVGS